MKAQALALPSRLVGSLWIVLSAAGFGAMPIFAKAAYADGVDLPSLLFLRFALAGLVMAGLMQLKGLPWPRGRNLLTLVVMGGIGYVGQAFCYFSALKYATASLTALLLYLYPVIVTLISACLPGRRLSAMRFAAVLAALIGTGFAVGGSLEGSITGIALGIGAALIYSVYILVGERVTGEEGAIASGTVVMLAGAGVYGLAVSLNGAVWPQSVHGWMAAVSIALFSTVLAIVGFFAGMRHLGAADASTLSTLEPVVTVLLASLFLGEVLGGWQAFGGAIILCAVIVLARIQTIPVVPPRRVYPAPASSPVDRSCP